MSIPIIRPRQRLRNEQYMRVFKARTKGGQDYAFQCDAQGNIHERYEGCEAVVKCLDGTLDVVDRGVQDFSNWYVEPAVGRCVCGAEVELEHFTNTCDRCERDYNSSGQELAPREQWGEETGEHWSECF